MRSRVPPPENAALGVHARACTRAGALARARSRAPYTQERALTRARACTRARSRSRTRAAVREHACKHALPPIVHLHVLPTLWPEMLSSAFALVAAGCWLLFDPVCHDLVSVAGTLSEVKRLGFNPSGLSAQKL